MKYKKSNYFYFRAGPANFQEFWELQSSQVANIFILSSDLCCLKRQSRSDILTTTKGGTVEQFKAQFTKP